MTSRTFMGRGGGGRRAVVAPAAAVDEAADRQRGGDQGKGGVGGPGEAARRGSGGWRRRAWARGWDRRRAPEARAWRGAEGRRRGRSGLTQEVERVDVAATVPRAAGAEAQAPIGAERTDALPDGRAGTAADGERAEVQVGGNERAAAHGDGETGVRERSGEGDAAGTGGADGCAGRSGDVDAASLPASERRARTESERADHVAAERPAPGGARRRRGADDRRATGRRWADGAVDRRASGRRWAGAVRGRS
jgi:hypothetical protein